MDPSSDDSSSSMSTVEREELEQKQRLAKLKGQQKEKHDESYFDLILKTIKTKNKKNIPKMTQKVNLKIKNLQGL